MLQYAKDILPKVVTWDTLFRKELIKCVAWEEANERYALRNWCYHNFYDLYPEILSEVFEK